MIWLCSAKTCAEKKCCNERELSFCLSKQNQCSLRGTQLFGWHRAVGQEIFLYSALVWLFELARWGSLLLSAGCDAERKAGYTP